MRMISQIFNNFTCLSVLFVKLSILLPSLTHCHTHAKHNNFFDEVANYHTVLIWKCALISAINQRIQFDFIIITLFDCALANLPLETIQ